MARGGAVISIPRSKRIDASVLCPSFLLVARIDPGLKYAASNAICVVAFVTSSQSYYSAVTGGGRRQRGCQTDDFSEH